MKYYRGAQFVPMKGMAAMYYETTEDDSVVRFLTVDPASGAVDATDRPPVKKLFRPEMLESVTAEEFEAQWSRRTVRDAPA